MKWTRAARAGIPSSWTYDILKFHDLIDDEGMQAAWIREDTRAPATFTAYLATRPYDVSPGFSTLQAAKDWCIAQLVAERLDNT